jgi:hypothetical protein
VGLGGVGTYTGSASASSRAGALSVYGAFQITDFAAGSYVSLTTPRIIYASGAFYSNASYTSSVQIAGPDPTYDLVLPVQLSGSFAQTGGVQCGYSIAVSASGHFASLAFTPSNFQPGWHSLTLRGLPSNTVLDLNWLTWAYANVADQEWITDTLWTPSQPVSSIYVTGIVNHRSGTYSESATADFSHTLTFGQYALLRTDGSSAVDASLTGDSAYASVPEPSTVFLTMAGLGLVVIRWKGKAKMADRTNSSGRLAV